MSAQRPTWRFWLLVLLVAPLGLTAVLIGVVGGGPFWLVPAAFLVPAAVLLRGEHAAGPADAPSRIGWGVIGLMVTGLLAWAFVTALVVAAFEFG